MPVTVPHAELATSGTGHFDERGGRAMRLLLCDYEDAETLSQELLGVVTSLAGEQVRSTPEAHPRRPYLYARRVHIEPLGSPGINGEGIATWTKAQLRVEYQPLERDDTDQDGRPQVFLTERRLMAGESLRIENTEWIWQEGPDVGKVVADELARSLVIPHLDWEVTIHQWLDAPVSTGVFESAIGKVNHAPFRALWTLWGQETLLLLGTDATREWTTAGTAAWRIRHLFRHRRQGWNRFLRRNGQFYAVETSSGAKPYEALDFGVLFP